MRAQRSVNMSKCKASVLIVNIADLDSGNGQSYREVNLSTKHDCKVGDLVEVLGTGVRLFVVKLNRDCDGTPLYSLCHDKSDIIVEKKGFGNRKWINGLSEECLRLIKTNKE